MNKNFTLTILLFAITASSQAQLVLNEIYTDPNSGSHEFFELNNTSTSAAAQSVDGYTIMSYFEEGNKRGFYILDLPNISIGARGLLTGAAASPFNYQGTRNSNTAQFSWNDPTLPLRFGYLRRWVDNGTNQLDGNKNYDIEPLPANFNDFFSKRSGSGASYNAFVYKNGVLVNAFFGGSGGASSMPAFIYNMPNIRVEQFTATGISTFNINFKNYQKEKAEFVGQDAGTDNGFIRTADGTCGTWTKSSANVNHTPGVSNGRPTAGTGDVTLSAYLVRDAAGKVARITYNVTAASSFPIDLEVYADNGTVPGELDAADTYMETKTEKSPSDGPFTTTITPFTANALIVVKQATGCVDKVVFRDVVGFSTLPLSITLWSGTASANGVSLNWSYTDNEFLSRTEVERSSDSRNYSVVATVTGTGKGGAANYNLTDSKRPGRTYYRLRIVETSGKVWYSKLVIMDGDAQQTQALRVLSNPAASQLNLQVNSTQAGSYNFELFSQQGALLHHSTATVAAGNTNISLPAAQLPPGTYVLRMAKGADVLTAKFIRE